MKILMNKKGFTLVELLVVVGIVSFGGNLENTKENAGKANYKNR